MKNLTLFVLALFISLGVFAQGTNATTTTNTTTMKQTTTATTNNMDKKMKDCCWMKDGKMWCMMNGKTMAMTKDMTMKNGTMVMMDGTVKMKDGKTMMMKNGDKMDMDGNMMPATMKGQTTTK